jgi:hypothetical protein
MTFLAPGFLIAAVAAAVGMVLLHFIVTRRPRSIAFPTARFIPDASVAARTRSVQLSDLLLLAVRVLTVLLIGAALARPVFAPRRESVVRVIAADVSGSIASIAEVRDSVRATLRRGDALVAFDTAAWTVESPDSLANRSGARMPGSLSAGLIEALRSASHVRAGADSVELVIVSPATAEEADRATLSIRREWPGRARLVSVAAAETPDSAKLAASPITFAAADRPPYAAARNVVDTIGAVVSDGNVLVASFERRWRYVPDSLGGARVIARWADGEPAAIERDSAESCRKSTVIPVDSTGDMTLRPTFARFVNALDAACSHVDATRDTALAAELAGGTPRLASVAEFPVADDLRSPFARWLLIAALALALLEMVLRVARRGPGDDR